mmetsp:Transcript_13233/g.11319  ORF Transcript_13233/g.11319 Transcript_13233/m.11319 type:complete len:283 (+) Transcript_13233:57-905(+)
MTSKENGCFMLDMFGQRAHFNFKGRGVSKSTCGVLFTYIFLFIVLWSIFYTGRDIVLREEPETVESERFFEDPEPLIISPSTFNLAFGLQDPSTYAHYIDESIYKATATYTIMTRVLDGEGNAVLNFDSTQLELTRCKPEHFGPLSEKFANSLEINHLLCFDLEQGIDLQIQGKFESNEYRFITIDYSACDYHNTPDDCASEEVIENKLLGAYYAVYFTDLAFDPGDYEEPGKLFLDSAFTTFGMNYYKEYSFFIKHVEMKSDVGWMFSEEEKSDFLTFGKL